MVGPDIFPTLAATGLGQLEQPTNVAQLPQVDFSDLPFNTNGGNLPVLPTPQDTGLPQDFLGGGMKSSELDRIQPAPFNNINIRKQVNSSVFSELGYNRNSNEEDRYDKEQPWWEATKNAGKKLGLLAYDSFTSFFKQNADTFKSLTDTDVKESWKNDPNLASLAEREQYEMLYPNFASKEGTHWYSFVPFTSGSGDWWESFVPQLGFTIGTMAGAVVENAAIDLLTGGAAAPVEAGNSARKIYDAISQFSTIAKAAKSVNNITKGGMAVNGLNIGLQGWTMYNAAATEASMEAGMNYNTIKRQLSDTYKASHGYAPFGADAKRIEDLATDAGNTTYGFNIPVLLASNAIQFRNLLMPGLAKRVAQAESMKGFDLVLEANKVVPKAIASKSLRGIFTSGSILDKIAGTTSYLSNGKLAFLTEGVEESAQRFISSAADKFATDKFTTGQGDNAEALKYGWNDMTTESGLQEFIGGALGGAAFQGVGNIARRFANPKEVVKDGVTTYKYNGLNSIGIFSDKFRTNQRGQYAQRLADVMNQDTIEAIFKDEGVRDMFAANRTAAKMDEYLKNNDIFNFNNQKSQALNRLLYSGLKTGKLNLRLQQLRNMNALSSEELASLLETENVEGLKDQVGSFVQHIESRLPEFSKIYKIESDRYTDILKESFKLSGEAKTRASKMIDVIKSKYNVDNPDNAFVELVKGEDDLMKRYIEAGDEIEQDKISDEAELFHETNKDLIKDRELLHNSIASANEALIDHISIEEGRKAAIFAASSMLDSAQRARDLIKKIKNEGAIGIRIDDINNLLDKLSVQKELDRMQTYYDSLSNPITAEQREDRANLKDRVATLKRLLHAHEYEFSPQEIAQAIQNYLLTDPSTNTNQTFQNTYELDKKLAEHKKDIEDIIRLQLRHQENLNLYNWLTSFDVVGIRNEYESARIKDFLQSVANTYLIQETETPVTEEQPEEEKTKPVETTTAPAPNDDLISRINNIKSKLARQEVLSAEEINFLLTAAPISKEAADLYNSLNTEKPMEFAPGETVIYKGQHDVIDDITEDPLNPGKYIITLSSNPDLPIPSDQIQKIQTTEITVLPFETIYKPEPLGTAEDDKFDEANLLTHRAPSSLNNNRTIVQEQKDKDDKSEMPELSTGYTAFKQRFLDIIATTGEINNYEGYLSIDTTDNYPTDSKPYEYLINGGAPGVILTVQDKSGHDRFDENYLPKLDGNKLVYSLVNSDAKASILQTMKEKNIVRHPVSLDYISHGAFDVLDNPQLASRLLEDISSSDYELTIAVGIPDQPYFNKDGILLRNGGFYILTKGSYIKLLPVKSTELKVGEILNPNIFDLIGRNFINKEEATNIAAFLARVFFTSYDNGLQFAIQEQSGKYSVVARIKSNNKVVEFNQEILKGFLRDQRINVLNSDMDQKFDFYYIDNNELKKVRLEYGEFLKDNSLANKKAYTQDGKKVLKPINRFISLNEDLAVISNLLKNKIVEPKQSTTEEKGKTKENESLTKPTLDLNLFDQFLDEAEGKIKSSEDKGKDELFRAKTGQTFDSLVDSNELSYLKKLLGRDDLLRIAGIANSDAWATWTTSGITLFNDAPSGTGYHEAWHHFSQLYLTIQEKHDIYNELRSNILGLTNATDLEVEEHLAEDFRKYAMSDGTVVLGGRVKRNSIFRKIWNFIKSIFGQRDLSLSKLYNDLYKLNLSSYKPSINNAIFGKLNSKIVNSEGLEIFNNQKSARYLNYMDSLMGQFLGSKNYSTELFKVNKKGWGKDLLNEAYQKINLKLVEEGKVISKAEADFKAKNGYNSPMAETVIDFFTIINNYKDIFNYFIKRSNLTSETIDTDSDFETVADEEEQEDDVNKEEQEGVNNAGKLYDRTGNEQSVIEMASAETKALIRTLSKVQVNTDGSPEVTNGKVVLYRNQYGLTEPVSFSQLFNNLAILLEGSFSPEEVLVKLRNSDNQKKFPEIALILERLPLNKPVDFFASKQITSFAQDFGGKTYVPIYSLIMLSDGTAVFKEETKRTKDLIKREWSSNFVNASVQQAGVVLLDENKRPYLNPVNTFSYKFNVDEDTDEFLNTLGIVFSDITKKSPDYKRVIDKISMLRLQETVNKRLEIGQKISNPINDLLGEFVKKDEGGKWNKSFSERSILNAMIELESKYSTINPSMSFRNAKGTMQYGLSLNNTLINTNHWLSRTRNYSEIIDSEEAQYLNISNNPHIKNSIFLNLLFDMDSKSTTYIQRRRVNGESIQLITGNYNGMKVEDTDKITKGFSTTQLSSRDKIIMDMNSLFSGGASEIPRTESSESAYFVRLTNYADKNGTVKHLPITLEELDGDLKNEKLLKIFKGYFEDEVNTIQNKFNSKLPGYNNKTDGPGRFSLFKDILPGALRDSIESDINEWTKQSEVKSSEEKQRLTERIIQKYSAQVDKAVSQFFEKEVIEFNKLLKAQNVNEQQIAKSIKEITTGKNQVRKFSPDEINKAFVVNDFILNVEYIKLFAGNTAFYKAYHKRAKGNTSTGTKMMIGEDLKSWITKSHEATLAYSLGVPVQKDFNKVSTLNYKDDERSSHYISHYEEVLKKLKSNISASELITIIKPYRELNIADGQGHITLDFYRILRQSVGNWNYEDEVQYRKEVIQFRRDNELYGKSIPEDKKARDDEFMEANKDVSSIFNPLKIQHDGPINIAGVFAPVLDKFSVVPLIPSIIKDTPLEDINKGFIQNGIGYSKFISGTKKYIYTPINFYSDNFGIEVESIPKGRYELFTTNIKEQIKTSSKLKEESIWGTQMRKLFMANLFSLGESSPKFKDILAEYKRVMQDVIDVETKKLYKDFGITEEGNQIRIKDAKPFVETLKKQIDARNLNDNIKDAVGYDKDTGGFVYPLEILTNKSAIQDLISGMIYKRLTTIKLPGDSLIQIASSGFEKKDFKYRNPTDAEMKKYGTNGLAFYHMNDDLSQTQAMQVKVALNGDFENLLNLKHIDGKKIETLARLNESLGDDKWKMTHRDKITMIGYRIPTQGINSMEFMEIAEFLPKIAGSTIILPAEIVAKSGSDYDIDKMNIIRPSLTENGELVIRLSEEEVQSKLMELEDKYQTLREGDSFYSGIDSLDKLVTKIFYSEDIEDVESEIASLEEDQIQAILRGGKNLSIVKEYRNIKDINKKVSANQLIDIYKRVLSSPEVFPQLITPNNVELVKTKAIEMAQLLNITLEDYKDTDVYGYRQNLTKYLQLGSGKRELGIYALQNTHSQLIQQAGLESNETYKVLKGYREKARMIEFKVTDWLFGENKPSLSSNLTTDDILKQEYFNQLISSTVDIAKDPYYVALGLNRETIGVFNYLLMKGLPFDTAVDFINQPSIRRYVDERIKDPDSRHKGGIQNMILGLGQNNAIQRAGFIEKLDSTTEASVSIPRKSIQMQPDNISKILSGIKKTTTRSSSQANQIDIPTGQSGLVNFGGKDFIVTNRGLLSIQEAGGRVIMEQSEAFENNIPKYQQTKEWLNGLGKLYVYDIKEKSQTRDNYLTPENLKAQLNKYKSSTTIIEAADVDFQRRIFAYFLKLVDQAQLLRSLQSTANFDTTKFLTPISVQSNIDLRAEVKASGLFNEQAVDKMRTDSLISAFNTLETNKQIFAAVMPVGMASNIVSKSASLLKTVFADKATKLKIERSLNNDWMEFIIKNFGKVEGQNFEQYSRNLLFENQGAQVLADRLIALKNANPELSTFALIKRLFPNLSPENPKLKNIELYRGLDNTTDLQNILIEEYRALQHFNGSQFGDKEYKDEELKEIRDFMDKLSYGAFQQDGFNRSPISLTDIVPQENLSPIFRTALNSYKSFISEHPEIEPVLVDIFSSLFIRNNSDFNKLLIDEDGYSLPKSEDKKEPKAWRGKNYWMQTQSPDGIKALSERLNKSYIDDQGNIEQKSDDEAFNKFKDCLGI